MTFAGEILYEDTWRILLFGNFGPPLLAFARSCRKAGIQAYLIDLDAKEKIFWGYSSALEGRMYFPKRFLYTKEGIQRINEIAEQIHAQIIIAVSDSFNIWLSRSRSEGLLQPVPVTSSPMALERLYSKEYQNCLARKHGLQVLDSWYIQREEEISLIPEHAYPVCIRPSDARGIRPCFKARVCGTKSQLTSLFRSLESVRVPIIAQPYKNYPNMILCMVRNRHGKGTIAEAFLAEKKFEGFALKISRSQVPETFMEQCIGLVTELDITGLMHFDFLYHDNVLYFLEINARLGGVTDKVFKLGYDEPQYSLSSFFDRLKKPEIITAPFNAVVNKKTVLKYILFTLLNRNEEIDYPRQSFLKHLAGGLYDLFLGRDSIFDPEDIQGYLWFYFQRK